MTAPVLSESLLREAAEHSLQAFLEPNAIFLAELLHASYPSPSSTHLLATAHLRQGNYSLAADVLRPPSTPENRYLYAVCQARINTPASLREAEAHLRSLHVPLDADLPNHAATPGGAAGLYLLATICQRTGRKDEAVALFCRAAAANPTLWLAFDALAAMGIVNHVDSVLPPISDEVAFERLRAQPPFYPSLIAPAASIPPPIPLPERQQAPLAPITPTPAMQHQANPQPRSLPSSQFSASFAATPNQQQQQHQQQQHQQHHHQQQQQPSHYSHSSNNSTSHRIQHQQQHHFPPSTASYSTSSNSSQPGAPPSSLYTTPSPLPPRMGRSVIPNSADPSTPAALPRRAPRLSNSPGMPPFARAPGRLKPGSHASMSLADDGTPVLRNPTDLFATPASVVPISRSAAKSPPPATPLPPAASSMITTTPGGPAENSTFPHSSSNPNINAATRTPTAASSKQNSGGAMAILRAYACIAAELGRFRCARALELTSALPPAHRGSPLVLAVRGRALLEKGDYRGADREFARALKAQPSRMDGVVEYYSTVLWHLRKEKALAQLAIRAQKVIPVSSAAWCAAGNCFSLQQDADSALRFFKRAIAASRAPNAYAHTLCGHEYVAKENFDAALSAYREALHIDSRHYNAMYGIGQVLLKQEKFEPAQSHFRMAVQINPRNSSLHYHLGVALAAAVRSVAGAGNGTGTENDENSLGRGIGRGHKHALVSALAELETAANLEPNNPVPRFERAKILVVMGRQAEARAQLEELRDAIPKEAEVHFELGRVCQVMGDLKSALQAVTVALDMEPKERRYKKTLETLSNELEGTRGFS